MTSADTKAKRGQSGAQRLGAAVLVALLLVTALRLFVITPYRVVGHAMEPTMLAGDWVLVSRVAYNFGEPVPGDVICFDSPGGGGEVFFGRVIALGGQTVELREGRVYLDGAERPLGEDYVELDRAEAFGPLVVPEGRLFVMGDNRRDARDSRIWGTLESELVIGRALGVYFSTDPYALSLWPVPEPGVRWERIGRRIE
jgi:signal peptidase I